MRPIGKGEWPLTAAKHLRQIFNDWTKAIPVLKERTGKYCHLCEMKVTAGLTIDHIQPRKHFPGLSGDWHNFLLACVHCNSRKGDEQPLMPIREKYFWPHIHNTLKAFDYPVTALVAVNPALTPDQAARAVNLIDLYALDKPATATGNSDERFVERAEAYFYAIQRKLEFAGGTATVPAIVDLAKTKGFFSVWLKVFDDVPEVAAALVACPEFHIPNGCFDAGLRLQNRNSGDL